MPTVNQSILAFLQAQLPRYSSLLSGLSGINPRRTYSPHLQGSGNPPVHISIVKHYDGPRQKRNWRRVRLGNIRTYVVVAVPEHSPTRRGRSEQTTSYSIALPGVPGAHHLAEPFPEEHALEHLGDCIRESD